MVAKWIAPMWVALLWFVHFAMYYPPVRFPIIFFDIHSCMLSYTLSYMSAPSYSSVCFAASPLYTLFMWIISTHFPVRYYIICSCVTCRCLPLRNNISLPRCIRIFLIIYLTCLPSNDLPLVFFPYKHRSYCLVHCPMYFCI